MLRVSGILYYYIQNLKEHVVCQSNKINFIIVLVSLAQLVETIHNICKV